MMLVGSWQVFDCPACGCLHPVYFDRLAGTDGDDVCVCPIVGTVELGDASDALIREVVAVQPETP